MRAESLLSDQGHHLHTMTSNPSISFYDETMTIFIFIDQKTTQLQLDV